jgi:hypothetical protein
MLETLVSREVGVALGRYWAKQWYSRMRTPVLDAGEACSGQIAKDSPPPIAIFLTRLKALEWTAEEVSMEGPAGT